MKILCQHSLECVQAIAGRVSFECINAPGKEIVAKSLDIKIRSHILCVLAHAYSEGIHDIET